MMRFFGSSAPAAGVGPLGQLDSLRVPARMAWAKLMASFFPRPAASFGLMLSFGAASAEASPMADSAAGDAGVAIAAESMVVASAGAGAAATSPPLTVDFGASAAQPVRTRNERTPASGVRTEDM